MPLRVMSVCGTLTSINDWNPGDAIHHFIDIHVDGEDKIPQQPGTEVLTLFASHNTPWTGNPELLECRVWGVWITH